MSTGNEELGNDAPKQLSSEEQIAALNKKIEALTAHIESIPKGGAIGGGMTADDIAKLIQSAVSSNRDKEKEIDYEAGIQEEQIPVDDFDKEGVRFCSPNIGYVIVDDVRKGHRVKLPFGKKMIFFDYANTRKIQQGKYQTAQAFSVYTSHSKRITQWLREHSKYNIFFYESHQQAINADASRIQTLSKIMTVLQNYEVPDILKRCDEYGVPKGEDWRAMRLQLAYAMAQREEEVAAKTTAVRLDDLRKESLMKEKIKSGETIE